MPPEGEEDDDKVKPDQPRLVKNITLGKHKHKKSLAHNGHLNTELSCSNIGTSVD